MAVTKTPGGRALGRALRMARNDVGVTVRDLAALMDVAHSTITAWENSNRIPQTEDVARLLGALGITGERCVRIMEIARTAREPNRLTSGSYGISEAMSTVIECEQNSSRLIKWSPLLVPGLLQIGSYARQTVSSESATRREIDTRVTLRVGRRETLTRRGAPDLLALIGEPALCADVGGDEVMADQLAYLREVAALPNVSLRVVPTHIGHHDGLAGAFTIFEFVESPPMVFLEHHRSSVFLYDTDDVPDFQAAAENIRSVAMSELDSLSFIAEQLSNRERKSV